MCERQSSFSSQHNLQVGTLSLMGLWVSMRGTELVW